MIYSYLPNVIKVKKQNCNNLYKYIDFEYIYKIMLKCEIKYLETGPTCYKNFKPVELAKISMGAL